MENHLTLSRHHPHRRGGTPWVSLLTALLFACPPACCDEDKAAGAPFRLLGYGQNHGVLRLDCSFTGQPLKIGSKTYTAGLGTHAASRIEIALGADCREFKAEVGVDGNARQNGAAVFMVKVDGRVRFRSRLLRRATEAVSVAVNLKDAKRLVLIVEAIGSPAGAHADWADARIVLAGGREIALSNAFRVSGVPDKVPFAEQPARAAKECSVKDYGAAGDGKADDSPAFQSALNEIACAKKGVLRVPAGDYRIARMISVELAAA